MKQKIQQFSYFPITMRENIKLFLSYVYSVILIFLSEIIRRVCFHSISFNMLIEMFVEACH